MKVFILKRNSSLPQKDLFHISTDIKNFHKIMPRYFKSLDVMEETETKKFMLEKIKFFGITLKIKTLHVIKKPNVHEVYVLSGPTQGTVFIEKYISSGKGTDVSIEVQLVFNGLMKVFGILQGYVAKKMERVMSEFIYSAENYYLENLTRNS
jgi:hypothetical protein